MWGNRWSTDEGEALMSYCLKATQTCHMPLTAFELITSNQFYKDKWMNYRYDNFLSSFS